MQAAKAVAATTLFEMPLDVLSTFIHALLDTLWDETVISAWCKHDTRKQNCVISANSTR